MVYWPIPYLLHRLVHPPPSPCTQPAHQAATHPTSSPPDDHLCTPNTPGKYGIVLDDAETQHTSTSAQRDAAMRSVAGLCASPEFQRHMQLAGVDPAAVSQRLLVYEVWCPQERVWSCSTAMAAFPPHHRPCAGLTLQHSRDYGTPTPLYPTNPQYHLAQPLHWNTSRHVPHLLLQCCCACLAMASTLRQSCAGSAQALYVQHKGRPLQGARLGCGMKTHGGSVHCQHGGCSGCLLLKWHTVS